jgi:hypothetical protein
MSMNNKTQLDIRQAQRLNILKSLEHRLAVAQRSNNTRLIEQLEAEKRYYAD